MNEALTLLVQELAEARVQAHTLPAPSTRGVELSFEDAYRVQRELSTRLERGGHNIIGRKIGLTNQAVWPQLGLDRVIWGPMFDKTVQDAEDNRATLPLDMYAQPRIEPEIVFGLKHAPPADKSSPAALLEAAAWYALGFEIVHCHYPDWKFTPADAVADYGLHGALIVGTRQPVTDAGELALKLGEVALTLFLEGEIAAEGVGKNVVGHPALALGWLAETLQESGEGLQSGEIVTTGSLTAALPIEAGQRLRAEVQYLELPALEIGFT
jgi:2-keto-4-pentenoate hydratase